MTVPLPLPLAPLEIVNQAALLVAVQAQPALVLTVIVAVCAAGDTVRLSRDSVYVQLPPTCWRKLATTNAVLFNVRALSCDGVPVTRPLYVTSGDENCPTRRHGPYAITVRNSQL